MRFGRSYRRYLGYVQLLLWRQLQKYGYILIALGIALAVIGVRQLGGLETLELNMFDSQVRYYAAESGLPEVVVVGITEADIRHSNQWPLSDQTVAELLEHLQGYQPAAIGLDLYRNIEHPPGRQRLLEQLTADNVYVIYDVGLDVTRDNLAPEEVPAERWGFADFVADTDGVIRRNFMFASVEPDEFYSLGLRLSLHVLKRRYGPHVFAKGWDGLTIANTFFPRVIPTTGGYHDADTTGYQVMLQYQTRNEAIRQVSLRDVLNDEVNPDWFKHKVVLIGTVASSINDLFVTPLNTQITADVKTPGVLMHARAVSQILSVVEGKYGLIWSWTQWQEILWIGSWCLIGGALVWYMQRLMVLTLCSAIALSILIGIGWGLFFYGGWIPVIPAALGFAITFSSTIAYQVCDRTFYDSLTSLPNRLSSLRYLQRCLDQRPDSAPLVALLLIDLDLFKSVNESLGVTVADQLLKIVAERLVQHLPTASVARVGSDQFAAIVPAVTHTQAAISTTVHLQKRLMDSIHINGQLVSTTISIGIALHQKGWGYRAHELLQDAHRALAKAKNLGRDRHEVFNENMRVKSVSQFQLEMDLRHAKDDQQFQLYYQPIIDLTLGEIAGFEALIRWHHPERGMVPPNDFIGIAEDTGIILSMGEWILHEACRQIQQWQQRFPKPRPLFIGVNLSSRQFVQQDLATTIATIVQQHQIDPCGLKLELTESVAMEDVDAAIQQLVRLKNKGLQISLDDFGTGYSSLSYLHRFPIDSLKIDKSFVDRMESISEHADIVGTIVSLGHRLQLDIIAEGVETMAQARLLKQLQCQYAQGYFFAKPLPEEQAVQLLIQNQRWHIEG
ncbi:diguanylate cyclase phosphodiesterase with chase sensor [Leptolyngbya sp. Heron Island J]|uniref:EAL domain-containing protein n=1 Tax=Leptolyngbya sp. Heron Island J TaxID=1385935 RepID=UPI0003B984B4|nr:EAL domain-containing protein [Leptolyngbya sp. Heron Island J]ESA38525.1 diguanylate cyclase phosphodiesterase with chase sensor [Leptolyngbya sp. Heron Island J]